MATYFSGYRSSREQNEVFEMEVRIKDRLRGHGLHGIIKNSGAIFQRMLTRFSTKTPEIAPGECSYETSETYKSQVLKAEHRISQAWADAERMRSRMI